MNNMIISNIPLQALSDLATKSIFSCSGWLEVSSRSNNRGNVTADLICDTCRKEKTFIGKAYSRNDLASQSQRYAHDMIAHSFGHGMMPITSDSTEINIEEIVSELALPIGDVVVVQLSCPTCRGKIYICYHIETEYLFDESMKNGKVTRVCVTKIGEWPNQEASRLYAISKYIADFPDEYNFLAKAERAFYANLGAGAVIYLRKAYEILLYAILDKNNAAYPNQFRQMLQKADEVAGIVPESLKDRAYGLFGEMSDAVHGETIDSVGLDKYECLRDVFKMILDNILDKRRQIELAEKIKLDSDSKRGGDTK